MKKLLFILILFFSVKGFGQTTGAKGYWRLDGNSNDASGNGNNGTDTAITYSQANGILNGGAGFNGSTSFISLPNTLPDLTTFTISFWISGNSSSANQEILQYAKTADNANLDIGVYLNKIRLILYNGSSTTMLESTESNINNGIKKLITFTRSGTNANLYINGVFKKTSTTMHSITIGSDIIGIGRHVAGVAYFTGSLDEFILDNTVWSPATIKNYYTLITTPSN